MASNIIAERAKRNVSLKEFETNCRPQDIGSFDGQCPFDEQYILRMPIRVSPFGRVKIPDELDWLRPMIVDAMINQIHMDIDHPFIYVTVRHGLVKSVTDDEWHVDGFSTRTAHAPEQNYVWTDHNPTEYAYIPSVKFPDDFDTKKHNVNKFLEKHVGDVDQMEEKRIYCMDPYILHRRPKDDGKVRTFVRISFVAIEIDDVNNTQNPHLPREYTRDGVAFRNTLLEY